MAIEHYPHAELVGDYELRELNTFRLLGAHALRTGLVRIAKGVRSPPAGLRAGADHEIGYVVSGKVRIETSEDRYIASAGETLVASPDLPHATTALEDTVIFFTLATRGDHT